jgi:hypothetical protein
MRHPLMCVLQYTLSDQAGVLHAETQCVSYSIYMGTVTFVQVALRSATRFERRLGR